MNVLTGKCGCDCSICPSYKGNLKTIEQRKACSSGWQRYLGIRLSPEKLRACDGCNLPDSKRKIYYLNCKIRKCCNENGMVNCAYCSAFPCKELESVHSLQLIQSKEDFASLTGKNISQDDFMKYIEPYAGLKHLHEIRKELDKKDIMNFKKFSVKVRTMKFPETIKAESTVYHSLKRIHELITSLAIRSDLSYAEYVILRGKREQLLKILMVFGLYGRKTEAGNNFLELDAEVYLSHKLPGMYHQLLDYLDELKQYQIFGEIIILDRKTWQTPTGGLRKKGWKIRISFEDGVRGSEDLRVFRDYLVKLYKKHEKSTYKYFNMGDMSVMTV